MRKKDGYILAYVMFVLVFLCLVVVVVCSSALDNLTAQNAAVERMEQRLEAESDMEQFMATVSTRAEQWEYTTEWKDTPKDVILEVQGKFEESVARIAIDWDEVENLNGENASYECNGSLALRTTAQGVQVNATIRFTVFVEITKKDSDVPVLDEKGEPVLVNGEQTYKPVYSGTGTVTEVSYRTYSIQYTDSEGGGAE